MKALIRLVLIVLVIGGIAIYFFSQYNNTSFKTQTIDLAVDCSDVDNVLVTSTVNVVVKNLSSRSHDDISVKIEAFDESGNQLKEKFTTFSRTLLPNSSFDKPVTLPAGTKRCDCKIVSSHPVE
ncbi:MULTISPECIES: hypothetical protein [Spirosoma]|uniref:CARDB domain-containing protein n=1 Tax=Spirosoma liriopis TaxID=2937440 RepID=A0ABT0HQN0_9BACT|nr:MULTISPECIES: hypothetical protein [Spirosoma]MCK8494474.1 hypothetical protein [Spirosoma liriopis]UHG89483.1 hypothetical protein LQ777_14645 [Spirosoma oryzicola]